MTYHCQSDKFEFVIEDESVSGSGSNEIDSREINPEKDITTFFGPTNHTKVST